MVNMVRDEGGMKNHEGTVTDRRNVISAGVTVVIRMPKI
jgi:hypothetical protein